MTRTHPDDSEIQAIDSDEVFRRQPEATHACQGCPYYEDRYSDYNCPHDDTSIDRKYWCGTATYWFGPHIYIANLLER